MKKALAILMIFALVASVAVAEVSIGAWGRGFFVPAQDDGLDVGGDGVDGVGTDTAVSWGSNPRIGFTIAGNSDNVGFVADMNVDSNSVGLGDNQFIWVKPIDMVTVRLGNIYDDTLRGNAAFGSFNWLRGVGNGDGEDITFTRFGAKRNDVENFEIAVKPMDPLYVALYFAELGAGNPVVNMFANMQFGAGYKIDGIGQIKFQIIRQAATYDVDGEADDIQTTIEAAFNLTMIENLFAEIGFAMPTNSDVTTAISYNGVTYNVEDYKKIALYANYKMDAFTFHLTSINQIFTTPIIDETDVIYKVVVGVDYAMDGGIGIAADFSYTGVTVEDSDAIITAFAGVTKGFSNGLIGAGFQVKNDGENTAWALPVKMEYWF